MSKIIYTFLSSFSTLGGYTYDKIGFRHSTLVIIGLQLIATLALFGMWIHNRKISSIK